MNELEQTLQGLFSNPEEMQKLSQMASQLLGGGTVGEGKVEPEALEKTWIPGRKNNKGALVKALSPYLSPDRQKRLEKAVRLAGMLRLAGAAMHGFGGDSNV